MDHIIHTVVILVAITLVLSAPIGTDAKRKYTILEGDNLLVICNMSDKSPDVHVYWTKNNTKTSFYQDGVRLEILNIKSSESGDYVCHALNTSHPGADVNKTVEVITVDVQFAARILDFSVEPHTVMENQTFSIRCNFESNPAADWTIRNKDTGDGFMKAHIDHAGTTLTSPPATCDYTGYWECTGINVLNNGVNVTRGHNVTVMCSPRPTYQKNNFTVTGLFRSNAFLILNAQGRPFPNYTWSRDDGSGMTSSVIQHDFEDTSILEIDPISIADFGKYTVKMENDYGTNFAHYELKANGNPIAASNIHYSDVTDESVSLQWTPGYDMGSRQYFSVLKLFDGNEFSQLSSEIYCNYTNIGTNQTCTYKQTGLYSNKQYHLTISSRNQNGFRTMSKDSVRFTTKERDVWPPEPSAKHQARVIIAIVGGVVGAIAILALIVFLLKYRNYKTSYNIESKHQILGKKEDKLYGSNKY